MPKIRGIKPDYWTDEDIVELSIPARLLFIGLWSYACDNGHLQDKPKQIKMRLLPGDDVSAADLLDELTTSGRITRADGWITIPKFTKHQKPDKRYFQTCEKPGCCKPGAESTDSQPETRGGRNETTTRPPRDHGVVSMGPHGDGDGDGDGDGELTRAGKPAKRATQLPRNWQPNDDHRAIAAERGIDVDLEATKMRDWATAEGKTGKDWDARFRNWLRNARPTPGFQPVRRSELVDINELPKPPNGLTDAEYVAWAHEQKRLREAAQ